MRHDLSKLEGRLAYLRDIRAFTTQDAATFVGITTGTWERWERDGEQAMREELRDVFIGCIASLFECSQEWLRNGKGPVPLMVVH